MSDFAEKVKEQLDEAAGYWHSCTGCYESIDGHSVTPIDPVFRCAPGSGCRECGGIGVVWDNTDYSNVADGSGLCQDCPPVGYTTEDTRCTPCPRRRTSALGESKMPSENEIKAAAKAMIVLAQSRREQGREMPSRWEEASAALEAAETVRCTPALTGNNTRNDRGSPAT